jgi:hypothetical protein
LLATGIDAATIIKLYKKYPQFIKGFGELKCYDRWKEGELPYGNLEWIRPILEFNKALNLPVYIHFNLDSIDHRNELEDLLKQYSSMPIVLCHAGMVDNKSINDEIHMFVLELLKTYNNLYVDLSTLKTRGYYLYNTNKLLQLPVNRVIIGSDINPIAKEVLSNPEGFSKQCYAQLNKLSKFASYQSNIDKLFNVTNDKADKLITLYQNKFDKFGRHCQMHLLTRGNLIGMFPYNKIESHLIENAKVLDNIINDFIEDNYDNIVNNLENALIKEDDNVILEATGEYNSLVLPPFRYMSNDNYYTYTLEHLDYVDGTYLTENMVFRVNITKKLHKSI